jgi:hypothetical protein
LCYCRIKNTADYDLPNILAGASAIVTVPIIDVVVGSSVSASPSAALTDGLVIAYARVSSSGNVEIKFTNTSIVAINQPAGNLFISVIQ